MSAHSHDEREAIYVMDGEIVVEYGGERIKAPARPFLLVPGGVERRHFARAARRATW